MNRDIIPRDDRLGAGFSEEIYEGHPNPKMTMRQKIGIAIFVALFILCWGLGN